MSLAIDFSISLSGTTLTVTLLVGAAYPDPVNSFQIDTLTYDDGAASFLAAAGASGFTVLASSTPPTLTIGGSLPSGTVPAGSPLATLTFSVPPGTAQFAITDAEGSLNADVPDSETPGPIAVACFAAGTRIRTPAGEVAVEALAVGDAVCTLLGGATGRIAWLGQRSLDGRRHPRPQDVHPVHIAAGALAEGVPSRPLVLSPDHALYLDGVLVPVRYLLNGASIRQRPTARITYHHVELDRHDVLLAEGALAETYLDTGNRGAFLASGVIQLDPDFSRAVWADRACARLVTAGPALAAIRQRLHARALHAGHAIATDPELRLLVDGVPLAPGVQGDRWQLHLPPGARSLCLASRSAIPGHSEAASTDHRRLGVAVAALGADGRPIPLDDPRLGAGWHGVEPGWRWTDGAAQLDVTGLSVLELTLAMTGRYWVAVQAA